MSNISFPKIKENPDRSVTFDNTINVSDLSIRKGGSAYSTTIINNRDGTYQFNASASDEYSVYMHNKYIQGELRNVYIALEDSLLQTNVDDVYIEINGKGNLSVINGTTLLYSASIVDNLTSSSSLVPISANQLRILNATFGGKETADNTILKEEDLYDDLTGFGVVRGTTKGITADGIRDLVYQEYTSEDFTNNDKTIPENIENLELILKKLYTPTSILSYHQLYGETAAQTGSNLDLTGSADVYLEYSEDRVGDRFRKMKTSFYKQTSDKEIIFNVYASMSAPGDATPVGSLELLYHSSGSSVSSSWTTPLKQGNYTYEITKDISPKNNVLTDIYVNIIDTTGSQVVMTKPELLIKNRYDEYVKKRKDYLRW